MVLTRSPASVMREKVTYGTDCPTLTLASWLSAATILGTDSTSSRPCVWRARSRKSKSPLETVKLKPLPWTPKFVPPPMVRLFGWAR